jgi:hypothetical protein
MANLYCNVLVKFGEGAVEAEQGAIRELAWKKSHATQHKVEYRVNKARKCSMFSRGRIEFRLKLGQQFVHFVDDVSVEFDRWFSDDHVDVG